jgi:hypothetical protein
MDEHPRAQAAAVQSHAGVHPYVRFCRIAAVVFGLVAAYTLVAKVPQGGMAHDWLHTALHIVTWALAVYLGWFRRGSVTQRAFTVGVVAVYGLLGIVGWFIDGIALHTTFAIPLAVADNVFHLALALVGLSFIAVASRRWARAGGLPG